jgi:hypothetical protein
MPFVKLDVAILDSTLWLDAAASRIFLTALLMATPWDTATPMEQIAVRSLKRTGFVVPPGWYGFVPAAGIGIIRRALVPEAEGYAALEVLGSPDEESRSHEFEGRRIVRVDGGFLILNFMKFRERDHTAAERMRRCRDRKKVTDVRRDVTDVRRNVTHAEAQADTDTSNNVEPVAGAVDETVLLIVKAEPSLRGEAVRRAIAEQLAAEVRKGFSLEDLIERMPDRWRKFSAARDSGKFEIHGWGPANFFGGGHWRDEQCWPWRAEYRPGPARRYVDAETLYSGPEYQPRAVRP